MHTHYTFNIQSYCQVVVGREGTWRRKDLAHTPKHQLPLWESISKVLLNITTTTNDILGGTSNICSGVCVSVCLRILWVLNLL